MLAQFYWLLVALVILAGFYLLGIYWGKMKFALLYVVLSSLASYTFYYFHLEQILVKHYGGSMSLTQPEGTHHMGMTWKNDHLWLQHYDPRTNECVFREYSRGSMLQGEVRLRQCNPLLLQPAPEAEPLP